jgi:hypothetical protein
MNADLSLGSAEILKFPEARIRRIANAQEASHRLRDGFPREPVEIQWGGSAWYHDLAIRDAARGREG